jgi:DNA-binding response OmpR family regulator
VFFAYIILGSLAGATGAIYILLSDATFVAVVGTFVAVSQTFFWGSLSLEMLYRRIGKRIFGLLDDEDFVSKPANIFEKKIEAKPNMKCLIVDDDELCLSIMEEMLNALGHFDVTACLTAHDALTVIGESETPFECLFLDIDMPHMDGVTLCGAIRAQEIYRDVPIVMVTAKTGREHVKAAFGVGATDYITKPYSLEDLQSRISAIQVAVQRDSPIEDGGKLISLTAMDNYLLQIERGGLFATSILTIKIEDFDLIEQQVSNAEKRSILQKFAVSTLSAFSATDALIAYAGDGVLASIINSQNVDVPAFEVAIERRLSAQIRAETLAYSSPLNVIVSGVENISLSDEEGQSVFHLHCKIHDAAHYRRSVPKLRIV